MERGLPIHNRSRAGLYSFEPMTHHSLTVLAFALSGNTIFVVQPDSFLKLFRVLDLLSELLDRLDHIAVELPFEKHREDYKEEQVECKRDNVEDQ